MTVSVEYLAEHVDEVLAALSSGETVEVPRDGESTLRLTATAFPERTSRPRTLGAGAGEMRSVSWEEWKQIDRDWKRSFLDETDVD